MSEEPVSGTIRSDATTGRIEVFQEGVWYPVEASDIVQMDSFDVAIVAGLPDRTASEVVTGWWKKFERNLSERLCGYHEELATGVEIEVTVRRKK